jgi:DNA-binding response OmpR family regulator
MKVLIADDDRVLSHLLSTRLKAKGCNVLNAYDAMQTMMAAVRGKPDVILLDIHMPGGTGIETLKKLKANSYTALIPVVVLSGSMDPATASALVRELGAEDFISKPTDPDKVFDALVRALNPVSEAV